MEFFQPLYPHETIGRLINQLKNLQGNLGDFKDLSVQQESLQQYVRNVVQNWILPRLSAD
jgi:CHAD domain-containing protein